VAIRVERHRSQIEAHLRNLQGFYKDIARAGGSGSLEAEEGSP
jgi:hypothetical protein